MLLCVMGVEFENTCTLGCVYKILRLTHIKANLL